MIWATISSRSCFCWLYGASPSLAAKNNQSDFGIDHLVMSMCRVVSYVVGRGYLLCMTSAFSWQNSVSLCPASFCTTRPGMIKCSTVSSFIMSHYYSPALSWNAYIFILFQGGRTQRKDGTISRKDSNLIYVPEGNLHNLEKKKNLFILMGLFPHV